MSRSHLWNWENLQRVRYAHIGIGILATLVCGYLVVTTFLGLREVWGAEELRRRGTAEAVKLSRQASEDRRAEALLPAPSEGGVDQFAVQFARWSAGGDVRIESFVPEGAPTAAEIKHDGSQLGSWTSTRIRVKGQGDYAQLMTLLHRLRKPGCPVQLASFALQSDLTGTGSTVYFDVVMTVYEKGIEDS